MKPQISEFSYGYALTNELTNLKMMGITAAPIFPSLYEEGKAGGGYDLKLNYNGVFLFLQFKLSDYMTRRNSKEIKDGPFATPYYRMHLHSKLKSNQHQMLIDLQKKGSLVYYVTPAFHAVDELNSKFLSKGICESSLWVLPSELGPLPDNDEHYLAYQFPDSKFMCSEPKELSQDMSFSAFSSAIQERMNQPNFIEQLRITLDNMQGVLSNNNDTSVELFLNDTNRSDTNLLELVSYYANVYFSCQLIYAYNN